ncbi:histidine phosphatase family protein [Lactobacillus mulieris]|uniref:histidine phosphatase family protein n=1 Tax=Lactobacillus mulieris TaxID=2508708 RepID=UPI00065E8E1D|nr:histidine phosphatase family protein [Lactobacillus mulieris]MCZ9600230.1 histidine phosphatase family protein [Lactobacillus mulieris]
MARTIYFVRHGETLFNTQHRAQGRVDSPLTDLGIRQAKAVKKFFEDKNIRLNAAFSSTQERACDTLELIVGHNFPYKRLKDLRERSYGVFEARADDLLPWGHGLGHDKVDPTIETYDSMLKRMNSALKTIFEEKKDDDTILVSSHGNFLAVFTRSLLGGEDLKGMGNCCVVEVKEENKRLQLINIYEPAANVK